MQSSDREARVVLNAADSAFGGFINGAGALEALSLYEHLFA